jgi:ribonucleotide monophosphatase NagD (HAD superfamily)
MVGDDIESDIGGALSAGLAAVLVRTGKFREEAVAASGIEPTAIVDSAADLPALLLSSSPQAQSVPEPDGEARCGA